MSVWSSLEGVVILKRNNRISVREVIDTHLGVDEVVVSIDRIDINTVNFHVRVCRDREWASESLTRLAKALVDSCYCVNLEMYVRW